MSDWQVNYTGPKFEMPASCSYDTWLKTGACSFSYTGLQTVLNSDITFRFYLKTCAAFNIPSFTFDCSGNACSLISNVVTCTQSSDCPMGTICWDFNTLLTSLNVSFDALGDLLSLGTSEQANSCTGQKYYLSDMDSLLHYFMGSGSGDSKFCFWNVTAVAQQNLTSWLSNQLVPDGSNVKNLYIENWTPNFPPPASPSTISFTITLSANISLSSVASSIETIMINSGYINGTFTVTVTLSQKRSTNAVVTVTSNDPTVVTSLSTQLKDTTTALSQQIVAEVGTVVPSSVQTTIPPPPPPPSEPGTSSPSSPSSAFQLVSSVCFMVLVVVAIVIF